MQNYLGVLQNSIELHELELFVNLRAFGLKYAQHLTPIV